ncbi:MAG: hypothetical protein AABZ60_07585 [Planctomycetota bacterium]
MAQYTQEHPDFETSSGDSGIGCGGFLFAMICAFLAAVAFNYYRLSERKALAEKDQTKTQPATREKMPKTTQEQKKIEDLKKIVGASETAKKVAEALQLLQNPDKNVRKKALQLIQDQKLTSLVYTLEQSIYQEKDFELSQEMEKVVKYLEELIKQGDQKK